MSDEEKVLCQKFMAWCSLQDDLLLLGKDSYGKFVELDESDIAGLVEDYATEVGAARSRVAPDWGSKP